MSTVFILKPIIDVLYNEVNEYKKEIERLNKIIDEMKKRKTYKDFDNAIIKSIVNGTIGVNIEQYCDINENDDNIYAKEAEAPPTSQPTVQVQVEKQNNTNENDTILQEDTEIIKTIGGKNKKEYMKEYQRNYRKKQKEKMQNVSVNKT